MLRLLRRFLDQQQSVDRALNALARQVAELSVDRVCSLAAPRLTTMTLNEARGYVRARAAGEILRHTRLAISRHPGAAAWEESLLRRATDRVVPLAIRCLAPGIGVGRAANDRRQAA